MSFRRTFLLGRVDFPLSIYKITNNAICSHFTCYILIFCLFLLGNHYFSSHYFYFSSKRLLPTTSWLLPRVILSHVICLFVWILSAIFACVQNSISIPFSFGCFLCANIVSFGNEMECYCCIIYFTTLSLHLFCCVLMLVRG